MDDVEHLLHQNIKLIQQTLYVEISSIKQSTEQLQEEIKLLKRHNTIPSRQELIEELRIIQQRELNLMIREKRATPFISSKSKTIIL